MCDQYNIMESQSVELELFSEFLEQIDEEVLITDDSGIIIAVNSKIPNVWGGCTEDYVGKDCRTLNNAQLHGDAGQRFIEAVLQSEEKHVELYTEVNSEGKARHYLVRIFPFRNAAGTARRVVMTRLDLTKQAEVQQQLQSSQKKALIDEMMAYIAHEIRNPLMSIGGFASSLCRDGLTAEDIKPRARIIAKDALRLEKLLETILRMAKPSDIKNDSVDTSLVVEQVRELLLINPKFRRPGIQLELNSKHMAYADQDKLIQCLINLVQNAHEAVDKEEGLILIRTRYADATVYIEVEDNGPGIPEELQETIFTPYVTTKREGTGLGLAITRKLVIEMGGRIFLHSKENIGTVISIALSPALDVHEDDIISIKAAIV